MWARMRAVEVLEVGLEAGVVASERVHEVFHVRSGEGGVDHHVRVDNAGWCAGEVGPAEEGLKGVIAADTVSRGVGKLEVLETTSGDLVVIIGVTPTTKTVRTTGKDGRVEEVIGVWFWVRTGR